MQRQTLQNDGSEMSDIGGAIETSIQGLQSRTGESLCSLIQRIADLELENSRLKRTIKTSMKNGTKHLPNKFGKLGRTISVYEDATKDTKRPIDSTPFVVSLIDGSTIDVS